MRAITLIAGLALLLHALESHSAWREASSDHFVIYADESEGEITQFANKLQRYHGAVGLAVIDLAAELIEFRIGTLEVWSRLDPDLFLGVGQNHRLGALGRIGGSPEVLDHGGGLACVGFG